MFFFAIRNFFIMYLAMVFFKYILLGFYQFDGL